MKGRPELYDAKNIFDRDFGGDTQRGGGDSSAGTMEPPPMKAKKVQDRPEASADNDGVADGTMSEMRVEDIMTAKARLDEQRCSEDTADVTMDEEMRSMKEALDSGGFKTRTPLDDKFRKSVKKGSALHEEYQACRTYKQKNDFRVDWLRKLYTQKVAERVTKREWQKIDTNLGTYMDFGKVVEQFGVAYNKKRAIDRAFTYCKKCQDMGEPWIIWNGMSEDVDYLFVQRQYSETFSRSWGLYEKATAIKQQKTMHVDNEQCEHEREAATTAKSSRTSERHHGGSGASSSRAEMDSGKKVKKAKIEDAPTIVTTDAKFKALLKDCNSIKLRFHQRQSTGTHLVTTIKADESWAWARGRMALDLQRTLDATNDALDDFGRIFILGDTNKLKSKYEMHDLMVRLECFKEIARPLGALEQLLDKLTDMHARLIS